MDPNELQKQLAELMALVKDKCKQRRDAETARAQAEARLAKATETTTTAASTLVCGPKIAVPNQFDGSRGVKAKVYSIQLGLKWAHPFTQLVFAGEAVTYDKFTVAFQAMYFNTEKKSRAEKALQALKQTKSVAAYTHTFMVHAHNCGWEAQTLVSQYTQGLHKYVRLALVLDRTSFDTLAKVSQLALKIDNEIKGADVRQTSPAATANPNAMDILAVTACLSETDKTRMMRQGLCFRCGEHGHISRDCPTKGTTNGAGKGKVKEKVSINALEEEVKKLTKCLKKEGRANDSKNGGAQA